VLTVLAFHLPALEAGWTDRKDQTMAVQELPQEQRQFIKELVRFRNGLEPPERQILDSVVHQACEPAETETAPPSEGLPIEAEVARLVEKIEAFERTLRVDQRGLLDSILALGSHQDMDVEPHEQLLWSRWGGVGPGFWFWYWDDCTFAGGDRLEYLPDWWSAGLAGTYRCWKW
jgi:hypothetical protein